MTIVQLYETNHTTSKVATSVTGYFFPAHKLLPWHVVGIISLVVLAVAIKFRNEPARVI